MSGSLKPWSAPPPLEVGEFVRLVEDGPLYRVTRVSPTCATLKPRSVEPVLVEIPAKGSREARSFYVYERGEPWGDWQRTVPTGFVGIVLRGADTAEKWRLAVEEDFDRAKKASATGDVFERDFEALAPWADPDSAPVPYPGAQAQVSA